ncbi:MAG TPA: hypothetical protein PKB02_09800 [Anaerohalosphaeraceae bacterium]|nr:hypothetical protein [Anaerohalosphaeraceae bacterium]
MTFCRLHHLVIMAIVVSLLSSCKTPLPATQAGISEIPTEVVQQPYLYEVVRHLYRWYLDESEIENIITSPRFTFWVRRLEPRLDPGDQSVLADIFLPQVNITVKVKKADYTIEEMGTVVKNKTFMIIQITRGTVPARCPRTCQQVSVDVGDMKDYLFRTRNQQDFPDEVMIEHLRQALRKEIAREGTSVSGLPQGDRIIHLAPLSPIANETWVFWEDGRKLFFFASDIDLANPAVWEHETLMARVFDLDQQVVVSPSEAPGSNRFLTRYQVSRALFNCVVLGRRISLPPPVAPEMRAN